MEGNGNLPHGNGGPPRRGDGHSRAGGEPLGGSGPPSGKGPRGGGGGKFLVGGVGVPLVLHGYIPLVTFGTHRGIHHLHPLPLWLLH